MMHRGLLNAENEAESLKRKSTLSHCIRTTKCVVPENMDRTINTAAANPRKMAIMPHLRDPETNSVALIGETVILMVDGVASLWRDMQV